MSAVVIPLTIGITYVSAPSREIAEDTDWSVYRQAPGAAEPEFCGSFNSYPEARARACDVADRNCDRLILTGETPR